MVVAHVEGRGRRRQEDGNGDGQCHVQRVVGTWGGREGGDMEMFKVNRTWWWDMRSGQGDGGGDMEMVKTSWRWSKGHRKGERGDREEMEVTMDREGDHGGDP